MWARLTRLKQLHEQIAARVAEAPLLFESFNRPGLTRPWSEQAVEAEDFGKAEEVYQLQRLAEDLVMCRRFGVWMSGRLFPLSIAQKTCADWVVTVVCGFEKLAAWV